MASERECCDACGQPLPELRGEDAIVVSSPERGPVIRLRSYPMYERPSIRLFHVRFAARRPAHVYVYNDEPYTLIKRLAMQAFDLPEDRAHRYTLRAADSGEAVPLTVVPRAYYAPTLVLAWEGPET